MSASSSSAAQATGSVTARQALGTVQRVAKFGLVGDGTVGKTTVLLTYTTQSFIKDYVPTVFDNFSAIEDVPRSTGAPVRFNVILWDTAGQEDYVSVRKICYEQTDIFFLCFSQVQPNSFHNIKSKWLPELKQFAPKATLFLVGTKQDLLNDEATLAELKALGEEPVSKKQAVALQKEIGAELYLTCSGKDVESVNKMFRDALHFLLEREEKALEKQRKQWKKDIIKEVKQEKELEKMREKAAKAANRKSMKTEALKPEASSTSSTSTNNSTNNSNENESNTSAAPAVGADKTKDGKKDGSKKKKERESGGDSVDDDDNDDDAVGGTDDNKPKSNKSNNNKTSEDDNDDGADSNGDDDDDDQSNSSASADQKSASKSKKKHSKAPARTSGSKKSGGKAAKAK